MTRDSVTVVAAIIRRGRHILLAQRPKHVHLGGQWEFPGGKLEAGESLEAALEREVLEELGVKVAVGPRYMKSTHAYPERTVDLHFFECRITSGEPCDRHASALGWFLPEELTKLDLPAGNRKLVEKLKQEG